MADQAQLIKRMLAGDERAFDAFFEAYFARVYRFALPRLNGDVEAAREVVQATLTKAMRKMGSFRGEASMFSWICQICRHEVVDHIRASRRHSRHVVLIDDQPELRIAIEAIEAPEEYDLVKSHGR
ncbi:MAG: RNA polymerase sigma factor, partial [Steroidobacteraceae bacterium]